MGETYYISAVDQVSDLKRDLERLREWNDFATRRVHQLEAEIETLKEKLNDN